MVYGTSWGRKEISLPSTRQFVQWYPTAPTFLFPIRYSPCFEEELYSPGVIGCLSEAIHSLKDWGDLKQFSVCARFPLSLAVVDTKNPTVASWIWWQIKLSRLVAVSHDCNKCCNCFLRRKSADMLITFTLTVTVKQQARLDSPVLTSAHLGHPAV